MHLGHLCRNGPFLFHHDCTPVHKTIFIKGEFVGLVWRYLNGLPKTLTLTLVHFCNELETDCKPILLIQNLYLSVQIPKDSLKRFVEINPSLDCHSHKGATDSILIPMDFDM